MIITNTQGLPPPVVRAAQHAESSHDIGDADFSVTELIEPPRVRLLTRKYDKMIARDASSMGDSFIGTAADSYFGQFAEPPEMANVRLFVDIEVDGQTYITSGEFDWFDPVSGWLVDWKTPKTYEWGNPKDEREIQLNIYAYMLARHGHTVNRMNNTFIFKDFSPPVALYQKGYPPSQIANGQDDRIRVWGVEEVEEYIRSRIRLHRDATEETLCTDEDRWLENKYAVMNENATRAMNNATFDSQLEAEEFCATMGIPHERIQFRAGEPRRCVHWCSASKVCQQYLGDQ